MTQCQKKYKLNFVVLFGSQNKGKIHKESDLDIGVMDLNKETFKKFGNLYNDFSKIFSGFNIDVRFLKDSEPVFLYNALMGSTFLAGNKENFYLYRDFAYKNFVDHKPLFELKEKMLEKRQVELNKSL